ncbi:MAG: hypothetical protein ACTHMQ_13115 [Protaetiibacter sp.]
MSDLRFDLDALRDASGRIGRVSGRLDGTGDESRHLPDAAGHDSLRGALSDFRDKWSVHRDDLLDELQFLRDSLTAIADTFDELDSDLADRARHFLEVANETPGA